VPAPLSSHMLLIVLHSPFDTDSFALQRVSGTMRAKSFTKRRYHKGTARYCLSSRTVEGVAILIVYNNLRVRVPFRVRHLVIAKVIYVIEERHRLRRMWIISIDSAWDCLRCIFLFGT